MLWVELINLIILLTNNPHAAAVAQDLGLSKLAKTLLLMKPKTIHLKCGVIKKFYRTFCLF